MVNFYTALTKQIDDIEAAVREINEQLNPAKNALKNTVGIIHFYYEFVDTGVCKAIMDALPFELAGCISSFVSSGKEYGDFALSVTMLTSNEVEFSVDTLEGVDVKSREQISGETAQLLQKMCNREKPKMVMPFMIPIHQFSCDDFLDIANAQPDPIPLFGTIAFSGTSEGPPYSVGKGKISASMFSFISFYGSIKPKFNVTSSFAFDDSFGDIAEVTKSHGSVLESVNGMTALEYLKTSGFVTSEGNVKNSNIWAIPAILSYPDGTKVARSFLGIVDGTESVFSGGTLKNGAKIKFSYLSGEKTLTSAEKLVNTLSDETNKDIIIYSCAARAWSLGAKFTAEVQKIAECAELYLKKNNTELNISVTYSGGEICPVIDNNGKLINTLHNYTMIACSFN